MMAVHIWGVMLDYRVTVGWAHPFARPLPGIALSLSSTELVAIVDDDPFVRAAASSLVRSLGWETREFASAAAFLASDTLSRTRCLICDIQMAGMDGIELLDKLEADGMRIPTLFITAFASARTRERVSASAALRLIEKPIDAHEFEALIRCALEHG